MKTLFRLLQAWFDLMVYRWQVTKLLQEARQVPMLSTQRPLLEKLLMELKPELFRDYRPTVGQRAYLQVMSSNIEDYIERLRSLYAQLLLLKPLTAEVGMVPATYETSLDRFLVSKDGYYVSPENAIREFQRQALNFVTALQPADNEEAGLWEHNQRMLTRVLVDLRLLTIVMIDVSLVKN